MVTKSNKVNNMAEQMNDLELEGYEEQKVGEIEKTKITGIVAGRNDELRPSQYFDIAAKGTSKEELEKVKAQRAIEITCENSADLVISLPDGKSVHPKSKLAGFKRAYGKYPAVGMEVQTMRDENGYWRVILRD